MGTLTTPPTSNGIADRRGRGRPKADTELVTLTISIPRPVYEKLRDRAFQKRIFKSRIAAIALDEYLTREEVSQQQLTARRARA